MVSDGIRRESSKGLPGGVGRAAQGRSPLALLELIGQRGNRVREPKSKALGAGLFELRGHQVRLLYAFRPGRRIVIFDGTVKKQDALPADLVKRVRQMHAALVAVEERQGEGR